MNPKAPEKKAASVHVWLYAGFVLLTSFFTYMYRYDYPPNPFWDEPYHIASAQKYLNGVFLMEQHPPLGKLLIALGEKIVHANPKNDQFLATDYASIPDGFSFAGYRLFPSLLAWLTAPVLFFIFFFITTSGPLAALLSFLYIFDNAEIVHSRGAMIDAPLTFFGMLCVLAFLHLQRKDTSTSLKKHVTLSAMLGICFGLAITTKVVALIFILLFPLVVWRLIPDWRKVVLFATVSALGFLVAFVSVWQTHFTLGKRIDPKGNNGGYYQASESYKSILKNGTSGHLTSFPAMITDSLKYVAFYNKGVPRLDLCKTDENGSPFYLWPFGGRTINYRWVQEGEGVYRYLYLQSNPIGWGLGLLGVIFAIILMCGPVLFSVKEKLHQPFLLFSFLALYVGYMGAISHIGRVMYLYHYFLPLLFSFILFSLVLMNIQKIGSYVLSEDRRIIAMTILGFLIFGAFQFYRPLSFYEPISDASFKMRAVAPIWELTCVRCQKISGVVVPVPNSSR